MSDSASINPKQGGALSRLGSRMERRLKPGKDLRGIILHIKGYFLKLRVKLENRHSTSVAHEGSWSVSAHDRCGRQRDIKPFYNFVRSDRCPMRAYLHPTTGSES